MKQKPQSSEIRPGPGFRIRSYFDRPDTSLLKKLQPFATADISDLLNRLYTLNPSIKSLVGKTSLIGTACTVKVFPGDNLMVHKALDLALPGDVIVVDAGGLEGNGVMGDLIATKAKHRGITGFVIDGLVRDLSGLKSVNLPVYAKGTTPIGPLHRGPGEINFPISCGGIVVNPGDVICADEDGVVVVRQDFLEEIINALISRERESREYIEHVKTGQFSNTWVDKILEANQCQMVFGEHNHLNGQYQMNGSDKK